MSAAQPFWLCKTLAEMTQDEWEALCDGCGKCCLHKLEDEDTGEVYYTDVACRHLDENTCRCKDYQHRTDLVPECLTLTYAQLASVDWLPDTCAYRLMAEGKPLFDWHPLVSGVPDSVIKAGMSVKGKCVSEQLVAEDELEDRIILWVN